MYLIYLKLFLAHALIPSDGVTTDAVKELLLRVQAMVQAERRAKLV